MGWMSTLPPIPTTIPPRNNAPTSTAVFRYVSGPAWSCKVVDITFDMVNLLSVVARWIPCVSVACPLGALRASHGEGDLASRVSLSHMRHRQVGVLQGIGAVHDRCQRAGVDHFLEDHQVLEVRRHEK